MNTFVDAGVRQSFALGRRVLTGAATLPVLSGTITLGVGLVAAGAGHLLFDDACRGLGDDPLPPAGQPRVLPEAATR
jgi:hypothetical protein